jgi:uncharacterized protein
MTHKLLKIYLDETDMHGELNLYEVVVRRLLALDASGATVQAGIMGFGTQHKVHRKRLFGVSDDRPIVISVIDTADKIERIIPEIRPLVGKALMIVTDCSVV